MDNIYWIKQQDQRSFNFSYQKVRVTQNGNLESNRISIHPIENIQR